MGVEIVGVSFNKPEKNAEWVADQSFPYEVWSDTERALAVQLGAGGPKAAFPRRITRVLDASGQVVLAYDDVNVGAHPEQVLQDCTARFAK